MSGNRIEIGGPYFEDFEVGQIMPDAPAVTITAGHSAVHQALFGDRLRLPLDHPSRSESPATISRWPTPAWSATSPSARRPMPRSASRPTCSTVAWSSSDRFISGTRYTPSPEWPCSSKIWPSRASRHRPGGAGDARGQPARRGGPPLLALPDIPCRDPQANTGHADSFDAIPAEIDLQVVKAFVPPPGDSTSFARPWPAPISRIWSPAQPTWSCRATRSPAHRSSCG